MLATAWEWARNVLAVLGAVWLALLVGGSVVDRLRSGGWWWEWFGG